MFRKIKKLFSAKNLTFWQKLRVLPLRLVPDSLVVRVRGGVNKGFLWVTGTANHGCWIGTYEADRQKLCAERIVNGSVVWDIGANVGFYSLAFSRLVGERGRVYAFEPLGGNVAALLEHLRINEVGNVDVIQAALADETGLQSFELGRTDAMGFLSGKETRYQVPTYSGEEFMRLRPGARPALIKMDVEGAEGRVLAGLSGYLEERGPELWIALHGEEAKQECRRHLERLNYIPYYTDGRRADWEFSYGDEIYAVKVRAEALPG